MRLFLLTHGTGVFTLYFVLCDENIMFADNNYYRNDNDHDFSIIIIHVQVMYTAILKCDGGGDQGEYVYMQYTCDTQEGCGCWKAYYNKIMDDTHTNNVESESTSDLRLIIINTLLSLFLCSYATQSEEGVGFVCVWCGHGRSLGGCG